MTVILHDRVIKAVLFPPVCQYLRPIPLPEMTEYPATVIFDFKSQKPDSGGHDQINLRILSGSFPNIAVVKNLPRVNPHFEQLQDRLSFRPFTPITRCNGLKQLHILIPLPQQNPNNHQDKTTEQHNIIPLIDSTLHVACAKCAMS